MKHISLLTLSLLGGFFLLTACGGATPTDLIADAQNCLDNAQPSQADECSAKVDGLQTKEAYMIRCSAKFVKEGFSTPTKLAGALTSISGGNTGADGSLSMMAALAFTAEGPSNSLNSASAKQAFDYCTQAESKGLILLSGLAKTATVLGALGNDLGLITTDLKNLQGSDLETLMGNLQSNPEATEAVGSAVVAIYQTSCTNDQTTTGAYCEQFKSAVDTIPGGISDPTAIGQQIMKCYNDPTATGCTGF